MPTTGVMRRKAPETLAVRQNRQDGDLGITRTVVSTGSWPNKTTRAGTMWPSERSGSAKVVSRVGVGSGGLAEDSRFPCLLPRRLAASPWGCRP